MQEHFDPTQHNKPRMGRWVAEAIWPSPNVRGRKVHLGDSRLNDAPQSGQKVVATPASVGQASGVFCPGMRIDNELAGDQSGDDANSVCFDLPLDQPLELLGRAVLNIAFTANAPNAQIIARLCDVSPDGVSQRITYRPFNLTHNTSHETPEALVPGQKYTASFALNECAHRIKAGHTLRLALSNSYWPIIWPAPTPTEITLDLAECSLELPVRTTAQEVEPCAPADLPEAAAVAVESLRAPDARAITETQPDGSIVQETFDDFGATRDLDHGMEVGSHVTTRYTIHPDDPATAKFEAQWNFTFKRGDWQVEIDTENTMTCDAEDFFLHRKLRAAEGAAKTEVMTKEWSETVSRGLL